MGSHRSPESPERGRTVSVMSIRDFGPLTGAESSLSDSKMKGMGRSCFLGRPFLERRLVGTRGTDCSSPYSNRLPATSLTSV